MLKAMLRGEKDLVSATIERYDIEKSAATTSSCCAVLQFTRLADCCLSQLFAASVQATVSGQQAALTLLPDDIDHSAGEVHARSKSEAQRVADMRQIQHQHQ